MPETENTGPLPGNQASHPAAELEVPVPPEVEPFPIVGVGASAGGLAAFEAFFSTMPPDRETGIAIVFVQHLARDHKSILSDLIRRIPGWTFSKSPTA